MNNFGVFILSHGRPDNLKTYQALKRCGYTGKIYILVDDEDKTKNEYKKNYGDEVIIFDKEEAAKITDAGDNSGKRNSVLFARNYSFVIAKNLGLTHFWQLDDDYSAFGWVTDNKYDYLTSGTLTTSLDEILSALCQFMEESGAASIAMAQGGDLMGGAEGTLVKKVKQGKFLRKAMNSFLFKTENPVKFYGRMNDDVNMFTVNGSRGKLFITVPRLRLWQAATQSLDGGLTEMYLESGTYVKSFYTIMYKPSCAVIGLMGSEHKRLHHKVKWKYTVPQIISEEWKKL